MADNSAPGRLELVRAFINTLDREEKGRLRVVDPAEDRSEVARWLRSQGLLGAAEPSDTDLDRAIEVRECLRELAFANHDDAEVAPEVLDRLNRASSDIPLMVHFGPPGAEVAPREPDGVEAALGTLLGIVAQAMTEGTWTRLKACAKDTCRWAFYDRARNRSGRWCDMAVCGNRVKATTYRKRREAEA